MYFYSSCCSQISWSVILYVGVVIGSFFLSSPLHFTSGMSGGGAGMSVEFCVSSFDSNIGSCMLFTKSVSCLTAVALCVMSGGVSFALSCSVFCIYCSSNLKSRRGHCSLALALLPSQSSLDQSDGVTEGCGALYLHVCALLMSSCTKSFGGGLDNIYFVKVYGVSVLHIVPFLYRLYWVKSIPPVRPSSSGLSQGTSTFGLKLGRKVRHTMAFIPC